MRWVHFNCGEIVKNTFDHGVVPCSRPWNEQRSLERPSVELTVEMFHTVALTGTGTEKVRLQAGPNSEFWETLWWYGRQVSTLLLWNHSTIFWDHWSRKELYDRTGTTLVGWEPISTMMWTHTRCRIVLWCHIAGRGWVARCLCQSNKVLHCVGEQLQETWLKGVSRVFWVLNEAPLTAGYFPWQSTDWPW